MSLAGILYTVHLTGDDLQLKKALLIYGPDYFPKRFDRKATAEKLRDSLWEDGIPSRINATPLKRQPFTAKFTPEEHAQREADRKADQKLRADRAHATKFKSRLRAKLVQAYDSYVREAEHGDGYGFWREFKNEDAALKDFLLYLQLTTEPIEKEGG